jgi:hypothetical protein
MQFAILGVVPCYNASMTDQPDKPTPPARTLFGTQLVLPPNCRDVTAENAGKMFAIIGPVARRGA